MNNPYGEPTQANTAEPACLGKSVLFDSVQPDLVAEAISICGTCVNRACQPIVAELLADATDASQLEGVWDGIAYDPRTYRSANSRPRPEFCKRGHPFNNENTYEDSRGRAGCKTCRHAAKKAHRARTKDAA